MKLTRREGIIGLGLLAMGSGAAFTSAAFQSSTQPSADLRVVVEDSLRVRAGKAFRDGQETGNYGTVNSNYDDKFEIPPSDESFFDNDNSGLKDLDADETPKATVNDKINGDLKAEVGVNPDDSEFADTNDLGADKLRFPNILQVVNEGSQQLDIAILYDRNNGSFGSNGQYGGDVDFSGSPSSEITIPLVQHIYRFKVDKDDLPNTPSDLQISPDSGTTGSTITEGYSEGDYPASAVSVGSGQIMNIHLDVFFTDAGGGFSTVDTKGILIDKATDNDPFTSDLSVLDLLDGITVTTDPDDVDNL
jgi:hypothetical protein